MSMQVEIDHRESKLKELIHQDKLACPILYENLVHGDIVLYYSDVPMYVFERKTLADLRASIHDGQCINQKIKMFDQYDRGRIYYIIEGDSKFQDEALTGAIINTMLRDTRKIQMLQRPSSYITQSTTHDGRMAALRDITIIDTRGTAGKSVRRRAIISSKLTTERVTQQ